jgi:beta-alanine--pyruvate transaminase
VTFCRVRAVDAAEGAAQYAGMDDGSSPGSRAHGRNLSGLDAYWMPFTANRHFKHQPRLVVAASGHHYTAADGRQILDAFSGLWTTGLGHGRREIQEAVSAQIGALDYAPAFQVGHPAAFELADALIEMAPPGFGQAFFTNSGSEAVDTALKIALAYQRARGQPQRTRFVGRERGYHGVNFGGLSVGGIAANRMQFGPALLGNVSHLPATYDRARNAFARGLPAHGAELADALEMQVRLHGATIAAVIVEPVPGSTGVLPPPQGYLERLRAICDAHDILLIFDEVITGFGRVGAPFAAQRFGVTPDVITTAKGLTNGVIPMGAVLTKAEIYETCMAGPAHMVEFFHGYTYSGHPVATAAALASLALYRTENIFSGVLALEHAFEQAIHACREAKHVVDIRNFGLMGAIELQPRPGAPGARGLEAHVRCFEQGLMVRNGMDVLQFAPFLNSTPDEFTATFEIVRRVLEGLE